MTKELKITKEKTVAPHFGKDAIAVIVLSRALAAEEHGNESEQKLVKREMSVENRDFTLDGRKISELWWKHAKHGRKTYSWSSIKLLRISSVTSSTTADAWFLKCS